MTLDARSPKSNPIDAGDFDFWLTEIQASFQDGLGTSVPCGECRGCCTSSYFVHVKPADSHSIQAAARFISENKSAFPAGRVPLQPGELAILAIKVHRVFLARSDKRNPAQTAEDVIRASKEFEVRRRAGITCAIWRSSRDALQGKRRSHSGAMATTSNAAARPLRPEKLCKLFLRGA